MSLPHHIESFSTAQLAALDAGLEPQLVSWAYENRLVVASGPIIKRLAGVCINRAIEKAQSAKSDFDQGVSAEKHIDVPDHDLGNLTLAEIAGRAAACWSRAKLLAGWYDLQVGDLGTLNVLQKDWDDRTQGLERAVGDMPKQLGIVTFAAQDVFVGIMAGMGDAVRAQGPDVLTSYMAGPLRPDLSV
ncbi:MAG TPA: hypothetical protein VFB59_04200 [Candidatus Saccharimonadales bacterium]|nr:hypothetical protein [Candidatus Saccharimonadales bacterium]